MSFGLGNALQFDWSCEYVFVAGLRQRLQVAHTKPAASQGLQLTATVARAMNCQMRTCGHPDTLALVTSGVAVARHPRSFEQHLTCNDWQHCIALVQIKSGSLRNGAPFKAMPDVMRTGRRRTVQRKGFHQALFSRG